MYVKSVKNEGEIKIEIEKLEKMMRQIGSDHLRKMVDLPFCNFSKEDATRMAKKYGTGDVSFSDTFFRITLEVSRCP